MTLLVIQEKHRLMMGCDSAGIMKQDGNLYRINGEQRKLFPVDNYLIYCDGNGFLINRLMDIFVNKTNRTIKELQHLAASFFREYNKHYPDEYGPNYNYVLHEIVVATAEEEGSVLLTLSPEKDFQINVQVVEDNNYSVFSSGHQAEKVAAIAERMRLMNENTFKIFEAPFAEVACDTVGGCLTAYELYSGYNPKKFLEIDIDSVNKGVFAYANRLQSK